MSRLLSISAPKHYAQNIPRPSADCVCVCVCVCVCECRLEEEGSSNQKLLQERASADSKIKGLEEQMTVHEDNISKVRRGQPGER